MGDAPLVQFALGSSLSITIQKTGTVSFEQEHVGFALDNIAKHLGKPSSFKRQYRYLNIDR